MRVPIYLCTSILLAGCYTGWQGNVGQTGTAGDEAGDEAGDSDGNDSDGDDSDDNAGEPLDCNAGPHVGEGDLVRLSIAQYDNTVRDLLGVQSDQAQALFSADRQVGMFDVGAPVAPLVAGQLVLASETIAQEVDLPSVLPCDPASGEDSCADAFIIDFGRRIFRHDLSSEDVIALREVYEMGSDFQSGIRLVIRATLQSPRFVYLYIPDTADAAPGDVVALDDFSVASRLSYLLWNTTPDDALLDAASAGELSRSEGLEAQLDRMLADPRSERGVMEFYDHVLGANRVGTLDKDPALYPEFTDDIARDLQTSLELSLLDLHFGEQDGSLQQLITGLPLFASASLAQYYGWERESGEGFTTVTDADHHGGGVLMHPAMASLLGKPDEPAIVGRGVFVRTHLMCTPLPSPPASVDTDLPDPEPGVTPREHFEEHRSNPQCSGCHNLIDPVGYSMENYDSDGRWRSHYAEGQEIDATGEFLGGHQADQFFDDLPELEQILAQEPGTRDCMIDSWLSFAARREVGGMDECSREQLRDRLEQSNGSLNELIRATVLSDGFRYIAVPVSE